MSEAFLSDLNARLTGLRQEGLYKEERPILFFFLSFFFFNYDFFLPFFFAIFIFFEKKNTSIPNNKHRNVCVLGCICILQSSKHL